MPDRCRVAVAGLTHDHVWGLLRHWREQADAELVAASDPNPPLLEKARTEFRIPATYADAEAMFASEQIDVVTVATDNAGTAPIVEAAAARGIHVISEKPMAATLAQADRMLLACDAAGVQLLINWPTAWNPAIQTADRLIRDGAIGRPHKVKYLAAHQGPREIGCSHYFWEWLYDADRNGAGALMDYCCYGADMAAHWLGRPTSVVGVTGTLVKDPFPVDDNAIILMKYANAFGVAEASWTQQAPDGCGNPAVFGDAGTLTVVGDQLRLARPGKGVEMLDPDPILPGHRNGPEYLIGCLQAGVPVAGMCSAATSRIAQEILERGLESARTGREIRL